MKQNAGRQWIRWSAAAAVIAGLAAAFLLIMTGRFPRVQAGGPEVVPPAMEAPKDPPVRKAEPTAEELKKLKLNAGFEEADLKAAWKGSIEAPDIKSIELVKDVKRTGAQALKFTVTPGKLVNNGARSELAFHHGDKAGDERWYAWSIFIPKEFEDVPLKDPTTGQTNWQVMGQFHDQPDAAKGETWENFPGKGNSPPVAINYGVYEGNNVFGFVYGAPAMKTIAVVKIEKGRWYDVVLHIKWSRKEDGFGELWVNGQNMTPTPAKGSNMHNDASHYFKLGLYRNKIIKTTNSLYIDAIRFGDTREAVMP